MTTFSSRKLSRSRAKIALILVTALIIYNEYIIYILHKWPNIKCDSKECIKVLIVSDPQILGEQESLDIPGDGIALALARWDSDRYLAKTFQIACRHLDPDVVIFLGDLMDEGSVANTEEFARYLLRFNTIFQVQEKTKVIFVPGDNDIGGEDEPILPEVVERYQETFGQNELIRMNGFDFFKVNRLTYKIPKPMDVYYYNTTRIVLSHLPLLFLPMPFVKRAVDQIRPQIIFSGHHHKSIRITADIATGDEKLVKAMLPTEGPIWKFKLNDILVHEIMVPTCSYRMGVQDIGYGAAIIDVGNSAMWYSILWLPNRFTQLFLYLGAAAVALLVAILWLLLKLCSRCLRRR